MPTYRYRCPNPSCDHSFEEWKNMADRETHECPKCGEIATQCLTPVHFDYRMGLDSGFPTAYDKWAKIQKAKNRETGGMWDSNNNRYDGEHER